VGTITSRRTHIEEKLDRLAAQAAADAAAEAEQDSQPKRRPRLYNVVSAAVIFATEPPPPRLPPSC
jgi:hypothetical protein